LSVEEDQANTKVNVRDRGKPRQVPGATLP
jgi:hypothetical protein